MCATRAIFRIFEGSSLVDVIRNRQGYELPLFSNIRSGFILFNVQSIVVYNSPQALDTASESSVIVHHYNVLFTYSSPPTMSTSQTTQSLDIPDGFEERLCQREMIKNPLSTIPTDRVHQPRGNIPNTPLAASTISFLLGSIFSPAFLAFIAGALGILPWSYYQLGFFIAGWAGFHWGEFAVTAGWNLEKCSVDCEINFNLVREFCSPRWRSFPFGKWCTISYRQQHRRRRIPHYNLLQTRV
jgi:hypothetical protein